MMNNEALISAIRTNASQVFENLTTEELVNKALERNEGRLTDKQALAADTGEFTGRSPKDKFLVRDEIIVELDGLYWHNKPKQKEKDLLFEQQAKASGYDIVRFTDNEISETKGKCFEIIK
jgi:ATP-dependent phosphoenolpyruvate carboxykinase